MGGSEGSERGERDNRERRRTYRAEIRLTLIWLVLFLAAGHLGIWFSLFPPPEGVRLLGFPLHYAVALLVSWPGLLLLTFLYIRYGNRMDDRIEEVEEGDGARRAERARESPK